MFDFVCLLKGLLHPQDEILEVNGIETHGVSLDGVVSLLVTQFYLALVHTHKWDLKYVYVCWFVYMYLCVLHPSVSKQEVHFQGLHSHTVEFTIVAAEDSTGGEEESERVRFLPALLHLYCKMLSSCFA